MRVSIEGDIGVGKTSVLSRIQRSGWAVREENVRGWMPWLKLTEKDVRRNGILFQLKILLDLSAVPQNVVVERSPYSSRYIFMQRLYDRGLIRPIDYELYVQYHDRLAWNPDCVIYLNAPVRTCLERIRRRARDGESQVNLSMLEELHQYHLNLWEKTDDCPVWWVDGSLPPDEVYRRVEAILCYVMPRDCSVASETRPDIEFEDVHVTLGKAPLQTLMSHRPSHSTPSS